MNKFLIFFALVALTLGAPAPEEAPSKRSQPAIEYTEEREDSGPFRLRYVTAEGTIVSEQGRLVPTADGKGQVLVTDGEVSYVGPDGVRYVTKWSAGLDGAKAEGAHLPVPVEPLPVLELVPVAVPAIQPQAEVIVIA